MRRHESRSHKVKREKVDPGKYDLTHYIDDRVELLQKVFTILKPSEIKCILPNCIRDMSMDNVQELCLEELLGISSKRLHAILDGTDPPSDTSSSSEGQPEHMSLDSISSDEDIHSKKSRKKKKCKRKEVKRRKGKKADKSETAEGAGLTVLELLELQARARAIRAQLHNENRDKGADPQKADLETTAANGDDDDDEVLIKEEPPEVVELVSSDDEDLHKAERNDVSEATISKPDANSTLTITKRNDLTIIVPKQTTKKIKLNRSKSTISSDKIAIVNPNNQQETTEERQVATTIQQETSKQDTTKNNKEKKKKRKKRKEKSQDGSADDDEIKLQLSDSERQDLLEYMDNHERRSYSSESSDTASTNQHTNGVTSTNTSTVDEKSITDQASTTESEQKNNIETSETGTQSVASEDSEMKTESQETYAMN